MNRKGFDAQRFDQLLEKAYQTNKNLKLSNLSDDEIRSFARQVWWQHQESNNNPPGGQLFRHLLDQLPVPLTLIHDDGTEYRIGYANPVFEETTGYKQEEVISRDPFFLYGEDTDAEKIHQLREALRQKEKETIELRSYRKNGCPFWNHQTIAPLYMSGEPGTDFINIHQDVTGVREVDRAYKDQSVFFQEVNRNLPGVMFEFHKAPTDGYTIDYISEGFEELSGILPSDAGEDNVLERVHVDDREAFQFSIDASASSLSKWECKFRFVRPDGTVRWVLGSSEPNAKPNGHIAWRGVLIDITERKELEKKLKQQVREKKRANQLKSDILATATHDLRAPLNTILGLASTLQKSDLTHQQKRDMETIRIAGKSMLFLVNDILDFDRLERDQLELHPEPREFRSLIYEVMMLFRPKIKGSDITVTEEVEDKVPQRVNVDADRLKRVLVNLIDNALKHTQSGRIGLGVSCLSKAQEQVTLQFSVSDTGSGIPEQERKRIFQDRQQGDEASYSDDSGAGLGLSICQHIVQRMGGEMKVESEMGEGSTFSFTVQLEVPSPADNLHHEKDPDDLDGATVLVVDDNPSIRKLIKRLLEDANIEVTTTGRKEEALNRLTEGARARFDTVFLDRRLGDASGLDLIEKLQERSASVKTEHVYILTGDPESEVLEHVSEDEIAGVMNKPVSEEQLLKSIRKTVRPSNSDKSTNTSIEQELRTMLNNRCNPILIVDDDRQSQRILTNYLKSLTEEVVCVSSGQEALDLLHERPPSAVLMDLEMPGMDGIETMQEIRKTESQEGRSPVPIVIQTALAMEQAKQQCLSAGADAFLEKPIDPDELYGTLYHVLDSDTK